MIRLHDGSPDDPRQAAIPATAGSPTTRHVDLAGLDRLVLAIGTPEFPAALLDSLRRAAGVDHCMVIAFQAERAPQYLLTNGTIGTRLAIDLAQDYVGGFHDADPNMERIFHNDTAATPILLPFVKMRRYRRDYRKKFFTDAGICDKFATAFWQSDGCLYSNFYRLNGTGGFSEDDLGKLMQVGPVFSAAITRHFSEARRGSAGAPQDIGQALDRFFQATPPFAALTERERAVCLGILMGYTSEAIALRLGIGTNSVLTYRKRAYGRLQITSQNELFALVMKHSDGAFAAARKGSPTASFPAA